ncbi:MAG: hypothetical protein K2G55_06420 [Lachnospiraceae bacterium]|nr:hypothetical protein [Lachnospiraceae bacterium]MDE7204728.1 hypothetical protein [Lachnospiraceae bacterium]
MAFLISIWFSHRDYRYPLKETGRDGIFAGVFASLDMIRYIMPVKKNKWKVGEVIRQECPDILRIIKILVGKKYVYGDEEKTGTAEW